MKKHIKSISGVTLLEIMLVLAIASMVIVMSIRYYKNATDANNANAILEEIQNITAAADNLAQGAGGYSAASTTAITAIAGAQNMKTPYGSTIAITGGAGTTYTVAIPGIPAAVCISLQAKIKVNSKFTPGAACATTGTTTLNYTYNSAG
jgi:type II secretory pathway pseudopilin PulG